MEGEPVSTGECDRAQDAMPRDDGGPDVCDTISEEASGERNGNKRWMGFIPRTFC